MPDCIVKVKKLRENSKMLFKATPESACYDVYACLDGLESVTICPNQSVKIGIGLAFKIEPGWCGLVYARSGMASKYKLSPSNSVGVIDADYTGEVIVDLFNEGMVTRTVHDGDRIAQIMFVPVYSVEFVEVNELDDTVRGSSGFGSTGMN